MRKTVATILSAFLLTGATITPAAGIFAPERAFAQTQTKTCTAATAGYTAVANGNLLYLFDKANGRVWQSYAHTEGLNVTHMEFDSNGNLYFLDEGELPVPTLYKLDADDLQTGGQAENTGLLCNTFSIQGEYLYSANISQQMTTFMQSPLTDITNKTAAYALKAIPYAIASWESKTYALDGTNHLYELSVNPESTQELATLPQGSTSMVIAKGNVYGVTENGDFYGYSLHDFTTPTIQESGGFCAISTNGEEVYLVKGEELYTYDIAENLVHKAEENAYPKIDEIPIKNVKTELAQKETANVAMVETSAKSLLMEVDIARSETSFYPLQNLRKSNPTHGVRLAQTDEYTLFACYEDGYKTYLVNTANVKVTATGYTPLEKTGYANGTGKIYKYPLVSNVFQNLGEIERNAPLHIVGAIESVDGKYYAVKIGEKVGYIPQTHARLFEGVAPSPSQEVFGDVDSDKDAVWRLTYLLLGSVAICVLADYLILRKKNDD